MSAASGSVTVTVPLLQTNSADLAKVIDRLFIGLLYIYGSSRNPLSLISLIRGVPGGGVCTASRTS